MVFWYCFFIWQTIFLIGFYNAKPYQLNAPAQLSKILTTSAPDLICIIKYSIVALVNNSIISSNSLLFSIKNFLAVNDPCSPFRLIRYVASVHGAPAKPINGTFLGRCCFNFLTVSYTGKSFSCICPELLIL